MKLRRRKALQTERHELDEDALQGGLSTLEATRMPILPPHCSCPGDSSSRHSRSQELGKQPQLLRKAKPR